MQHNHIHSIHWPFTRPFTCKHIHIQLTIHSYHRHTLSYHYIYIWGSSLQIQYGHAGQNLSLHGNSTSDAFCHTMKQSRSRKLRLKQISFQALSFIPVQDKRERRIMLTLSDTSPLRLGRRTLVSELCTINWVLTYCCSHTQTHT